MYAKDIRSLGYGIRRDLPGKPFVKNLSKLQIRVDSGFKRGDFTMHAYHHQENGTGNIYMSTLKVLDMSIPEDISHSAFWKISEEQMKDFMVEFMRFYRKLGGSGVDLALLLMDKFHLSAHEAAIFSNS